MCTEVVSGEGLAEQFTQVPQAQSWIEMAPRLEKAQTQKKKKKQPTKRSEKMNAVQMNAHTACPTWKTVPHSI